MIASLGMYDLGPLQAANDRFWDLIRRNLGHGPARLTRDRDLWEIWQDDALLLAQTCGLPYRARLKDRVKLVGTPDHGLPGCAPGHYNSVMVARAEDVRSDLAAFDGAPFALNEALSQSGWAAPHAHMSARGLRIGPRLATGAHAASALAVAEGRADLAAIDALTWVLLEEHRPDLTGALRVIERTAPTPALPYVTGPAGDPAALAQAIAAAIAGLDPATRDALHLRGLVAIPKAAYLAQPIPPAP
ncbi:MAG: hypothetical protein EP307_04840 [Rhodobacteraceae bacterium]|nr:MAG: hypothetical protein EP307_04840 [Paracoccaceae bacterium]